MSNTRITLPELESYLWESANFLRSNIDAGEYKQYIIPLVLFKRLSDVYDEETEAAKKKYGEDFDLYEEEELHAFVIPDGAHWDEVRTVPENVGEAIVKAFHAIENANEKLASVFGDGAWTNKKKLPDYLLKDLMEHFSSKTLSIANCPEDELGNGYEYLIRKFADDSGHTAQEFYTNRTVVHLMTELLQPQPGESVYDPTCGTAGMLISCISYLKDQKKQEWRNLKLYGQEINTLTSSIAKINCILHGVNEFHIANGDTLTNPAFVENGKLSRFSICLANPPYSISSWNREAFATDLYGRNFLGTPSQGRADYAFIQHILTSLDLKNGRCAILLPHGVLNRQEEKKMRQGLIEHDLVDCVIGVGKNLFYNSPMEACVLICSTNKPTNRKNKVFFIDGRKYVTRERTESFITKEQMDILVKTYFAYENKEELAYVATADEIKNGDFSLAINKYVRHVGTTENAIDFDEALSGWLENSELVTEETSRLVTLIKG